MKCIANTAMWPILPSVESVDVPLLRIKSLSTFGIDFSETFPHFPSWDFNTLEIDSTVKHHPVFKNGIILSSEVPKHVTTLELLRNLSFTPKRVLFVDDVIDHAQSMYENLTDEGIETYSFVYSKAHGASSLDYFSPELAVTQLTDLESFLEKLLKGENVDEVFLSI